MEQRSNMQQISQGLKLVIIKFGLINNGLNIYNFIFSSVKLDR